MSVRDLLGFVLIPLVLVIATLTRLAGSGFRGDWIDGVSAVAAALAVGLLIVGATCLLCQTSPGQLPIGAVAVMYVSCVAVAGFGLLARTLGLETDPQAGQLRRDALYVPSFRTLVEFAGLLLALFVAPRFGRPERRGSGPSSATPG